MYIISIVIKSFCEILNFHHSFPFVNIQYFNRTFAIMNNV